MIEVTVANAAIFPYDDTYRAVRRPLANGAGLKKVEKISGRFERWPGVVILQQWLTLP